MIRSHQNNWLGSAIHTSRSADRRFVTSSIVPVLVAAVLVAAIAYPVMGETWTDSSGTHKVEAQFLALRGETVYLKKANGVVIAVPLNRLNAESQQQARQMAGPAPSDDTPDGAVRAVMEGVQAGDLRVVWDALPPSYQKDVNDVVHTFAENMDAELWTAGANIAKKAVQILKEKKEFILGYPALAQSPANTPALKDNWDAVVDVVDTIVNSELSDLEKLKTIDVGEFLGGTGTTIGKKVAAIAKATGEQELPMAAFPGVPVDAQALGSYADAKISTVKTEADTATIRIEKDGEVEEEELVRVEGKWLPKEMVDEWAAGIETAKDAVKNTMGDALKENKQEVLGGMTMIGLFLNGLLATQTQEEFNQAIDDLTKQFMPAMGGGGAEGAAPKIETSGADPFAN